MHRPLDTRLFLRDEDIDLGVASIFGAERRLSATIESYIDKAGLSAADIRILLTINSTPGQTVHALRRTLNATTPTMARRLGALARDGLIDRQQVSEDGRERCVFLTPQGQQTLAPIVQALRERVRDAYREAGADAVSGAHAVWRALNGGRHG